MATPRLPSVDRLLSSESGQRLIARHGRQHVTNTLRQILSALRKEALANPSSTIADEDGILAETRDHLESAAAGSLKAVINLTGTVLHTNLGRAPLPAEAIEGMQRVASGASNLEFDLVRGIRGERDDHIERLIMEITGAEAATVVNNNAAAVMLVLNTFALGKEVPVSRGELVEIGGSFRIPEIMTRAGCALVEVGATNRTHLSDYASALGERTGLVMKVHTSNYQIKGFTSAVGEAELAGLAHEHGIPLVTDLGSGTLVDLVRYGLPPEPTVQAVLARGADLVTFSGDKLLGGPQAGIIAGNKSLVDQLRANPMKRALRIDKLTLAALFEVLKLYRDPDSLIDRLPAMALLARPDEQILAMATQLQPAMAQALKDVATVEVIELDSQVGSGSLPVNTLPSHGLAIVPRDGSERTLQSLAYAFRQLPCPVIGRIHDGRLLFDLRTLEHPSAVLDQLGRLALA